MYKVIYSFELGFFVGIVKYFENLDIINIFGIIKCLVCISFENVGIITLIFFFSYDLRCVSGSVVIRVYK